MSPEDLRNRAHRLIEEVLNQGDLAVANELISPDCVHHVPGGQPAPGPASLRDLLPRILRIFPDFHAIVEDVFAAGDQVALRVTAYGAEVADSRTPAVLAALTKGGLAAATRSLAIEYASRGIRVNAVSPGIIQTRHTRQKATTRSATSCPRSGASARSATS
jgi:hypothetical protein